MKEHLLTYLDINERPLTPGMEAAADLLVAHPNFKIANFSRRGYVLEYFAQLIRGEITLEEFMGIGDEGSPYAVAPIALIDQPDIYLQTRLQLDANVFASMLVVVDDPVSDATMQALTDRGAYLFILH